MADVDQRFFCHQCSVEIPRIAADFTCPTCNSGFIEELGQAPPPQPEQPDYDDDDEPYDLGQVLGPLEALLPGLLGQNLGGASRGFRGNGGPGLGGPIRPRQHRIRIARGAPSRPVGGPQNLGMDQAALETALQDFIVNLAGMEFGGAGGAPGAAQFHFIGPGAGGPLGAGGGGFHLHGNPGDYAWGRGGLDAIITQLLNHMDGAGPPPMAKENIQEIPTVNISNEQMEKSQSCSVCWEDFTEGEQVKLLECEHCFHSPCIVPWLELHGTCPVCRKELGKTGQSGGAEAGAGAEASGEEPDVPVGGAEGGVASSSNPAPGMQSSMSQSMSPGGTTTQSVTVSGSAAGAGGLTGLIQSALNQVFSANWSSQPNPAGSTGPSSTNREPETPVSNSSSTQQTGSEGGGGGRPGGANEGSQSSTSDDDTPATRRQRLDSEFVDLDFD